MCRFVVVLSDLGEGLNLITVDIASQETATRFGDLGFSASFTQGRSGGWVTSVFQDLGDGFGAEAEALRKGWEVEPLAAEKADLLTLCRCRPRLLDTFGWCHGSSNKNKERAREGAHSLDTTALVRSAVKIVIFCRNGFFKFKLGFAPTVFLRLTLFCAQFNFTYTTSVNDPYNRVNSSLNANNN